MAIRDKIIVVLDTKKTVEVQATGPGNTVRLDTSAAFIQIEEQSRSGKVKNWKRVNPEHVVSIEFEPG